MMECVIEEIGRVNHQSGGPEEAALVAAFRAGRREAAERLVEREYDRLHRIAFAMTGSREDAADLVQATFLAALKAAPSFRGESRISTWLISILRNQYTLYLRGERRWRHAPLEAAAAARSPEPDRSAEDLGAVLESLRKLPEDLRTAVVLFHLEGMPYAQIAEAMECPIGTVRSRLFEARERLRRMLEGALP